MSQRLSIISSVAVIALVLYAAYMIKDVDRAELVSAGATIKKIRETFKVPAPVPVVDEAKQFVILGIVMLFVLTAFALVRK